MDMHVSALRYDEMIDMDMNRWPWNTKSLQGVPEVTWATTTCSYECAFTLLQVYIRIHFIYDALDQIVNGSSCEYMQ